MSGAVAWLALAWWASAIGLLVASFLAVLVFPWALRRAPTGQAAPALTAIVPIKHLDAGFDAAQASLFEQAYPTIEVLVACAEARSPALAAAQAVQARFAQVDSRIVASSAAAAASPKLNNLWAPIEQARHDLVFTKDSNVQLSAGDVARLVEHMAPSVGLVSAITVLVGPRSPAAWAEASLMNGAYARVLMLARAIGLGFGLGKIMLFRRSDLERAGGLRSLAWALGEDCALADAMSGLRLRTVLADRLTVQDAGARTWRELWNRLLRWKIIWRVQSPLVFVGSLFSSALLAAVAGGLAAPLMGAVPAVVALATLAGWCALECLMCAVRGWPLSLQSPLAFLAREGMDLLVWLRALTTSEVAWAGARCRHEKTGRPALVAEASRP